ncbi:pseudouridine synthase [Colwelliaceae bacterium 6441]
MTAQAQCFTLFKGAISHYRLPERFTFPFYYQPHPLCLLAAKELQEHLSSQTLWRHNFGLLPSDKDTKEAGSGKMFGVLLVKNQQGEVGYLSAFSGKIAEQSQLANFVPPVFDMLTKDSFFLEKQSAINKINQQIETLEQNPTLGELTLALLQMKAEFEQALAAHRKAMVDNRKVRKDKRTMADLNLKAKKIDEQTFKAISIQMSRESVQDKHKLADLKTSWLAKIAVTEQALANLTDEIELLKKQRKKSSNNLQKKLFQQYKFLNKHGSIKGLHELFKDTLLQKPPAGSGDCAAPKLLQYAFLHNLTPLAMAEFWWGAAPKSEIRQHLQFYPACQGKCQPILAHMLEGIVMDDNPLLKNPAKGKALPIVYQDNDLVIVNKPAEFLSVPGKTIEDSVYSRIKAMFPHATGSIIVHRLDMATSGLLVLALNPRAHKKLQQQFVNKTIKKRYVAIIEGELPIDKGIVELPLTVDINDRPRQLVCYQQGKVALTHYEKFQPQPSISSERKLTKVYLYPKTGRTHQLRVHCAHVDGLHMPILGDDLYGNKAQRLYLHAELLAFEHPITKKLMQFQIEADF